MPHETTDGGFTLSDDPARFDLARAHDWISTQSYWGERIPLETFAKACAHSLTIGAYTTDGAMVAMPGSSPTGPLSAGSATCSWTRPTGRMGSASG